MNKYYHEGQSTDVRMHLGTVDKVAEGHLDDAVHLIPPGSEKGSIVMRNDAKLPNTENNK